MPGCRRGGRCGARVALAQARHASLSFGRFNTIRYDTIEEAAYVSGLSMKRKHELGTGMHIGFKEDVVPVITTMTGMREKHLDFFDGFAACLLVPIGGDMFSNADSDFGWMRMPGRLESQRFLATPAELAPLFNKFNTLRTEDPKVRYPRRLV